MKNEEYYREREYELIEEIEDTLALLFKKYKILGNAVDRVICEQEVEDFLLNGPGGVDPN